MNARRGRSGLQGVFERIGVWSRSPRNPSRTDSRSAAVSANPPASHALTQTREYPSPVLVAKIVKPVTAASSIQANVIRRSSSAGPGLAPFGGVGRLAVSMGADASQVN